MKALSPADTLFLLIEGRRQPMHVAGLQLYKLPEGAPRSFIADLAEEARSFDEPIEPFNLYPKFRMGRWHWKQDDQFDLEHHFRHLSLPKPARIRELLALVSQLHGTSLDRSRPLWETNIIEGLKDRRFAVYSKVHHAMFDGVAATRMMQNSLDDDPNTRGMPPPWAKPREKRSRGASDAESDNPLTALAESIASNARILPGIRKGLWDLVRPSATDLADVTPYQAPPSMFNVKITSSRRFAAQSYPIDRIKAVGKAAGATLNDVVLAMCGGALREYMIANNNLPDEPLISMVPVSVRSADGPQDGNQVSAILASLATNIADPMKRLQTIIASTQRAKDKMSTMTRVEQIAYAAAALSPMAVTSMLGYDRVHPAFNVVISNVPGPTQPLYWNGARLDENYPVSIPIDGQALNITLTSYCDTIAFGFIACRRSLPSMQRLLDYTEQALVDLETATGIRA